METKNCLVLLWFLPQDLLPIREAYEWKHNIKKRYPIIKIACFQFVKRMNGNLLILRPDLGVLFLLPIREAYEWKQKKCDQKRPYPDFRYTGLLASNSWSVWMETPALFSFVNICTILLPIREAYEWKLSSNNSSNASSVLLPIREAYEWKRTDAFRCATDRSLLPIREAYEWKRCVGSIYELTLQFFTSN